MDRTVLITGATTPYGSRLIQALEKDPEMRVIGVDPSKPAATRVTISRSVQVGPAQVERRIDIERQAPDRPGRAEIVQADIRSPAFADLLRTESVDTLFLLHFHTGATRREAGAERNVIGTTKALGAALEAGVRKVVLMSSTLIYGAQANNPAFLKEDHPPRTRTNDSAIDDAREMDESVSSCIGDTPDTLITVLRFPFVVGPLDTPMTRYLSQPIVPVLLGFDPLMQVIHVDDVIGALVYTTMVDFAGVFNIAPEPVMPLMKVIARAGKVPVPFFHPLAYTSVGLLGGMAPQVRQALPIPLDYLRYQVVADTGRMKDILGYRPQISGEEALQKFVEQQRLRRYGFGGDNSGGERESGADVREPSPESAAANERKGEA